MTHQPADRLTTTKHEHKACPRCGAGFECKLNNPVHCQCAGIALSERLLDRLATDWHDCLCARCLRELAESDRGTPAPPATPPAPQPRKTDRET